MDQPLEIIGLGAAAIYHEFKPGVWSGPTGFYIRDYRAPLAPEQSKTWSPIHLWADPLAYHEKTMLLSLEAAKDAKPPDNRRYELELLYVPAGVIGAPPVGTVWQLPLDRAFSVEVPTYKTTDGRTGYRFGFTVHAVPEPASAAAAVAGVLIALRRRACTARENGP